MYYERNKKIWKLKDKNLKEIIILSKHYQAYIFVLQADGVISVHSCKILRRLK